MINQCTLTRDLVAQCVLSYKASNQMKENHINIDETQSRWSMKDNREQYSRVQ